MRDSSQDRSFEKDQTDSDRSVNSSCPVRRRWYCRPTIWLIILLGCFLFNLVLSIVPVFCSDESVSYVRNEQGQLISENGEATHPVVLPSVSLWFEASDDSHFSGDKLTLQEKPLLCRHVAVFDLSGDPLMQTAARSFITELGRKCPSIERIDYYPLGLTIEPGSRLPDLYFYLNDSLSIGSKMLPGTDHHQQKLQSEGVWQKLARHADFVPGADQYELNASFLYGPDPFGMSFVSPDSLAPPIHDFSAFGCISKKIKDLGLGLPITDDNAQAKEIGSILADNTFNRAYFGVGSSAIAPVLPDSLYPDFREADPVVLDIVKRFSGSPSVIGHGLMTHNDSTWVLKTEKSDREKLFAKATKLLKSAGWEIVGSSVVITPTKSEADEELEKIVAEKGNKKIAIGLIPKLGDYENGCGSSFHWRPSNEDGWVGIRYEERMNRETEVVPAIKAFLAEKFQDSEEGLDENAVRVAVMFEDYWKHDPAAAGDVRKKLEKMYKKSPRSLSVDGILLLARLQYSGGDKETAFKTFRIASLISRLLGKSQEERERGLVWDQAQEWDQTKIRNRAPSREELELLDFTEVTPEFQKQERIVNQNEPICLFKEDSSGQVHATVARIALGERDEWQQKYQPAEKHEFSCMVQDFRWGEPWGAINRGTEIANRIPMTGGAKPVAVFEAVPIEDFEKVKVTIRNWKANHE